MQNRKTVCKAFLRSYLTFIQQIMGHIYMLYEYDTRFGVNKVKKSFKVMIIENLIICYTWDYD